MWRASHLSEPFFVVVVKAGRHSDGEHFAQRPLCRPSAGCTSINWGSMFLFWGGTESAQTLCLHRASSNMPTPEMYNTDIFICNI